VIDSFVIGDRRVGGEAPLFVVAELGLNHGGDPDKALRLVDAAARAGASAIKLQTLRAATLVAGDCPAPMHVRAASLREFFATFELDAAAHARVAAQARARGLAFLSTPFDESSVDMLCKVGVDALKIASGDVTHLRLITTAAATGRPLIISTGMAELDEIAEAVGCARQAGATGLALLHCVSCYPTPAGSANLGAIATLARHFGVVVGLSDHGTDPLAAGLAVAAGASIYERHLVAHAADPAIDRAVSATPEELADIVRLAARTRELMGDGIKRCLPAERGNRSASRRGVHASRKLTAGTRLAPGDLVMLRPERGVPAARWTQVIGRRVTRDVGPGDVILEQWLEPGVESPAT
jgi:N-acetylneuraminate synthase/N,N'-diacetyllegionaminate synthase